MYQGSDFLTAQAAGHLDSSGGTPDKPKAPSGQGQAGGAQSDADAGHVGGSGDGA
jgi:hypothetical protein